MTAPGWYRYPKTPDWERHWNGTKWGATMRPAKSKTPPFPGDDGSSSPASVSLPGVSNLGAIGGALYVLAAIEAIGAIVGGALLLTHKTCGDTYLGSCFEDQHPFVGIGVAVLVGGLINAGVIAVIGRLCVIVEDLREYRDADAAVVLEEMGDDAEASKAEPGPQAPPWGMYGHKG